MGLAMPAGAPGRAALCGPPRPHGRHHRASAQPRAARREMDASPDGTHQQPSMHTPGIGSQTIVRSTTRPASWGTATDRRKPSSKRALHICSAFGIERREALKKRKNKREERWLFGSEVFQRTLITILWLASIRCGGYTPLQNIDTRTLVLSSYQDYGQLTAATQMFQQAAEIPANIFMIGVQPLIFSSIVMAVAQMLSKVKIRANPIFPEWERFFRERQKTPEGRARIEEFGNGIAIVMAVLLAFLKAKSLEMLAMAQSGFVLRTTLTYVFVVFCLKHISMEIEENGLGSGISFIICTNIVHALLGTVDQVQLMAAKGLLPPAAQLQLCAVIATIILVSVVVSKVQVDLKIQYYGSSKPPTPSGDMQLQDVVLFGSKLKVVKSGDRKLFIPIKANPGGVSPLLSAGIISIAFQQLGVWVAPSIATMPAFQLVLVPFVVGLLAFGCNVFEALGKAGESADFMGKVTAKLVGVPPGAATQRRLKDLFGAAAGIGGCVLGIMAGFSAWFDIYFQAAYGIVPGTTGVLLITNLFVSVNRKIEDIRARKAILNAFDKERAIIPEKVQLL